MVESIVYRLLPLLCWDDFALKVGFVLAFLLGLWLGWGWERKNVVISCLTCAAVYVLGVLLEGSRIGFWYWIGMWAAALMPAALIGLVAGKVISGRRERKKTTGVECR